MTEPEPTLAYDGNTGRVPAERSLASLKNSLVLLVAFAVFGVNLSCKSAVLKRERTWFFEGVNARWRYYADTLPMVAAQRLEQGKPTLRRDAKVHTTLGVFCYYDAGYEYADQAEMDAGVPARTHRQARTEEGRRRHRAYRSGRKASSRIWWAVYAAAMRADSSKPWTSDLADSLRAAGARLDSRLNPAIGAKSRRLKQASAAFKGALWRSYLKSRDSSFTKPAR
jgi:hypothetical protein